MSGLVGLVPLAELLRELGGGRYEASAIASQILQQGDRSLRRVSNDMTAAAIAELHATGVLSATGEPELSRAAELLLVCEVLAAVPESSPAAVDEPRLVFSAPTGSVAIPDRERLEGLVLDVIRRATTELTIAGAFWNTAGFDLLRDVLQPAITVRGVPTTIYVNKADPKFLPELREHLTELESSGAVRVRWFIGAAPTMLHAKLVVRDRAHGYLGTANLTS